MLKWGASPGEGSNLLKSRRPLMSRTPGVREAHTTPGGSGKTRDREKYSEKYPRACMVEGSVGGGLGQ